MIKDLAAELTEVSKRAATLLPGALRRRNQAELTQHVLGGSRRQAERVFGWARETVEKGLNALQSGVVCTDHVDARGPRRTAHKTPP